jgi:hypothetical protein
MKKTLIVAMAFAGMMALGGLARAARMIATPDIHGNFLQDFAECVVLNSGPRPLSVTVEILDNFGGTRATTDCSGPLGAGQFCSVGAVINNNDPDASACIATAPSTTNLRGTLVLYEHDLDKFGVSNLRPIRSAPLQ